MDPLLFAPAVHQDQDFIPASPHLYDASPHQPSPFDSFDAFPDSASHFPHTPSYNGSYQNSPYSTYSDLPPLDNQDDSLVLFNDNPSGISITEEYDPSEYDVPSSGGPLVLDDHYMNGTHVSVSVTPPLNDYSSPNAFDHSSPASSNGLEDDGHSHASSNSSYMHPNSPRPDISQSFQDSLSFHSPAWPPASLPDDRRSPPLSKPQSPPQLLIPDTTSPGGAGVDSPPIINAPDGDGGLIGSGPTLQIVPATPVSGGGVTAQNVPFRDNILQQGASSNATGSGAQDWTHQQFGGQSGQFADQSFNFPGSSSSSALVDDSARQQQHHQQFQQQSHSYLIPQAAQRSRSLSDTSARPPIWNTAPNGEQRQGGTVNLNDVLPGPGQGHSSDPLLQQNFRHPSSAGPHQTTFGNQNYNQYASDYLTVEAPGQIRRAKSDGGQRNMHTRQARSLELRPTHSLSPNSGLLFPPPGPAQQDFIRQSSSQFLHPSEPMPSIRGHHRRSSSGSRERGIGSMMAMSGGMGNITGWSGSQTSSTRPSPYPSPSASPRPGYHSLPQQDLGLSSLAGPGMGGMMGMNVDMGIPGSLSGQMGIANASMAGANLNGQITVSRRQGVLQVDMPGSDGVPITVTRPHVTTPSTAKASTERRKQPAHFACPVPGCGSTFTRHFNLKGHLRSHAEEKPYQCKWPGCGKGFARQHDCKRHEQLHLNIRPYPCEGCKKNFARMDALNRHLRSEGGAECRKIQEEIQPGSTAHLDAPVTATSSATPTSDSGAESSAPPSGADVKPDPDGAWTGGGMMM